MSRCDELGEVSSAATGVLFSCEIGVPVFCSKLGEGFLGAAGFFVFGKICVPAASVDM